MISAPDYKNRNPKEIVGKSIYFDSIGYFYRAMSWLDYFDRTNQFAVLHYSCVDARLGIEHLLFEELVMSTGLQLSRENYNRCLKSPMKFNKLIRQISPNYEKLKQFNQVVLDLEKSVSDQPLPQIEFWDISELLRDWGKISKYLHWFGVATETTDQIVWVENTRHEIGNSLLPIWHRMCSGSTGLLHFDNMRPVVREIWDDFKTGAIDINSVKTRLTIVRH